MRRRETRGPGEIKAPHPLVTLACQAAITAKHRVNSFYFHQNLSFSIYFRANVCLPDLLSVSTYTRSLHSNTNDHSFYSSRNRRLLGLYMHIDLVLLLLRLTYGVITGTRSTTQKALRHTLPNVFSSTGLDMAIQGPITR
jgi:hypothetical protein